MKNRHGSLVTTVALAGALAMVVQGAWGQQRPGAAPTAVDAGLRAAVIDGAIDQMRRAYIFEEVAEKMAKAIRARDARNEYDRISAPQEFANVLTKHLQDVSRDKHLRIVFNPEGLPQRSGPTPDERARALSDERRRNFGFERVERLDGNVGYIELRGFSGTPDARGTAVAAMNLVADTDALIFDLRRNGGGSPSMIGILSSYLFTEIMHLNDFYVREQLAA